MQVSLQSKVYLGTCIAINAYAAYSNPVRWITAYVLGVLAGTYFGRSLLQDVYKGYQPGNNQGQGWEPSKDIEVKEAAIKYFTNAMPLLLTTAINLLALGLISQKVQLPSGWHPRIETYTCDLAAFDFGAQIGMLFQLDILRKSPDPEIQKLLAQTTI